MKNRITPNQLETRFEDSKLLVSKTDPKGVITYCNPAFIEVSGYSEAELLGKQHNIVRHPDMPRVIFSLMWETLQNNREFNGYIKNMTKTGGFYWVFANVTPDFSLDHQLEGYYSVRRKPDSDKLDYINQLYSELKEIEAQHRGQEAIDAARFKLDSTLNAREMGYDEFILSL